MARGVVLLPTPRQAWSFSPVLCCRHACRQLDANGSLLLHLRQLEMSSVVGSVPWGAESPRASTTAWMRCGMQLDPRAASEPHVVILPHPLCGSPALWGSLCLLIFPLSPPAASAAFQAPTLHHLWPCQPQGGRTQRDPTHCPLTLHAEHSPSLLDLKGSFEFACLTRRKKRGRWLFVLSVRSSALFQSLAGGVAVSCLPCPALPHRTDGSLLPTHTLS